MENQEAGYDEILHHKDLSPIHLAVRNGDVEALRDLLKERDIDVNSMCSGMTPLEVAVVRGHTEIVALLLSQPTTSVNRYREQSNTPLFRAVTMTTTGSLGNEARKITQLLLDHSHIDINEQCQGMSPFIKACMVGRLDALHILFSKRHRSILVSDQAVPSGYTASHYACHAAHVDVVKLLIQNNCFQPFVRNKQKQLPIHLACKKGHYNMVRYICENEKIFLESSKEHAKNLESSKEHATNQELIEELLHMCCFKGHLEITKLLFSHAKRLEYNVNLFVCFQQAIKGSNPQTAKVILGYLQENIKPENMTSLNKLMQENYWCLFKQTIKELLYLWSRVNAKSSTGEKFSVMKEIYKKSTGIEKNIDSTTATIGMLYHAIHYNIEELVRLILCEAHLDTKTILDIVPTAGISLLHKSAQSKITLTEFKNTFGETIFKNDIKFKSFMEWYMNLDYLSSSLPSSLQEPSGNDLNCATIPVFVNTVVSDSNNSKYILEVFKNVLDHIERNQDSSEKQLIYDTIRALMKEVNEKMESIYEFETVPVGSSTEGTRPFRPDEFDFLLVFGKTIQDFLCIGVDQFFPPHCNIKVNEELDISIVPKEFLSEDKMFDALKFKQVMDRKFSLALREIFQNGCFQNHLFIHPNFYEIKKVSSFDLYWRGDMYMDMKIKIDVVPAFEFKHECLPPMHYMQHSSKSYAMCKQRGINPNGIRSFRVAFSEIEQQLMNDVSPSAKQGYILAKGMRIAKLFPKRIAELLHGVYCIDDYLSSYMLKTSLFICDQTFGKKENHSLYPAEWAFVIYRHLARRIAEQGELLSLFAIPSVQNRDWIFCCTDNVHIASDEQRACCIKRKNLALMSCFLCKVLEMHLLNDKHINPERMAQLEGMAQLATHWVPS